MTLSRMCRRCSHKRAVRLSYPEKTDTEISTDVKCKEEEFDALVEAARERITAMLLVAVGMGM